MAGGKSSSAKTPAKVAKTTSGSARTNAKIEKSTGRGEWRAEMLSRARAIIDAATPGIVETRKWKKPSNPAGVAVWEKDGIICTGETYKDKVKLTFANGAALDDPSGLFNAGLDGNQRRAIDLREGDKVDARALKALVKAAAAHNSSRKNPPKKQRGAG